MSEQATETAPAEAPADKPQEGGEQPKTFDADYVEKLRKEAAQYRTEKNALAKELDGIRKSSMTETEKAVAEAEARGRTAAATDFGKRLARSEFAAAAARRNPDYDASPAIDLLDLGRFVTEDGDPDTKAIGAAVERLVPDTSNTRPPSFDGGPRTTAPVGQDMNTMLRRATGRT